MKTAIITGGSGDIGRACCEKFYESGYNIVFGYLNNEKSANDLCEKLGSEKCVCVKADISDINQAKKLIETAVEKFGSVDVLVNNAGVSKSGLFQDVSKEELEKIININIKYDFNSI